VGLGGTTGAGDGGAESAPAVPAAEAWDIEAFETLEIIRDGRVAGPCTGDRGAGRRRQENAIGRTTATCDNPSVQRAGEPLHVSPYLLLTLTPFFWSCNVIVGRGLHEDVPPVAMTFFRWLLAILILAPFALPHVRRQWPIVRANWRVLLPLGVTGIGMHNMLAYLGLNYTTATNVVILNSFIPIMIIILAWVILRERLAPFQMLGVLLSLTGVLTILAQGSLSTLVGLHLNVGDLIVILAMAMWSLYTICLRWRPAALHPLALLFVLACIGDLAVLPIYLGEVAFGRHVVWSWASIAALFGVALFSSVLAYIFWNRGVAEVGPSVAGLFVHLMPVFGVLLAWMFLGEQLEAFHVFGIALILTRIYVTSRRASSDREPTTAIDANKITTQYDLREP